MGTTHTRKHPINPSHTHARDHHHHHQQHMTRQHPPRIPSAIIAPLHLHHPQPSQSPSTPHHVTGPPMYSSTLQTEEKPHPTPTPLRPSVLHSREKSSQQSASLLFLSPSHLSPSRPCSPPIRLVAHALPRRRKRPARASQYAVGGWTQRARAGGREEITRRWRRWWLVVVTS